MSLKTHVTGVRVNACLLDAPADPRLGPPLQAVWQDILQALAPQGTHEDSHR